MGYKNFHTAYIKGLAAFREGRKRSSCPYFRGTVDRNITFGVAFAISWFAGWDHGEAGCDCQYPPQPTYEVDRTFGVSNSCTVHN